MFSSNKIKHTLISGCILLIIIFYLFKQTAWIDSGQTHLIYVTATIINADAEKKEITVRLEEPPEEYKENEVVLNCRKMVDVDFEDLNLGEGCKLEFAVFPYDLQKVYTLEVLE